MGKDGAACVAYLEAADGPGPPGEGKLTNAGKRARKASSAGVAKKRQKGVCTTALALARAATSPNPNPSLAMHSSSLSP